MPKLQKQLDEYIKQLTSKEVVAYNIAKDFLGSSFNLEKSIRFQNWLKKNSINI